MFKTIVLALDGSEAADVAIPVAADLAKKSGGRIVIAHVDERIAGKGGIVSINAEEHELRAELAARAEALTKLGVDSKVVVSTVVLGGPAHAIADIAEDEGADLIVAGTTGHTAIGGLLGSTTQRLLHISRRPVLTVPPSPA